MRELLSDYVTAHEASQRLGLDVTRVRRYANLGKLTGVKVGRSWLFNVREVARFALIPRRPGRKPRRKRP